MIGFLIPIGIILFILAMYLDVKSDYKRIEYNTINHGRGVVVRAAILLPSFACFFIPLHAEGFWLWIFCKFLIVLGLLGFWWWEFFDGWLNTKRGKAWRYNGSDDPDDAKTDNILQKYTPKQQAIIKWSLIIGSTTLYLLTLFNVIL